MDYERGLGSVKCGLSVARAGQVVGRGAEWAGPGVGGLRVSVGLGGMWVWGRRVVEWGLGEQ